MGPENPRVAGSIPALGTIKIKHLATNRQESAVATASSTSQAFSSAYHPLPNILQLRFPSAPAAVYFAVATMNAWPNLDAALQGDHKAAAMAFVQYTFAFIVAISPVASAHEKGGQAAVLVFMLAVLPGKAKTIPR